MLAAVTDKDLAFHFRVKINTIEKWKVQHPEFFAAIQRGRHYFDAHAAKSLYYNAVGYDYEEEHAMNLKKKTFDANGRARRTTSRSSS